MMASQFTSLITLEYLNLSVKEWDGIVVHEGMELGMAEMEALQAAKH